MNQLKCVQDKSGWRSSDGEGGDDGAEKKRWGREVERVAADERLKAGLGSVTTSSPFVKEGR